MHLHNPPHNAINIKMLQEIKEATNYVAEDAKMKGLIITGSHDIGNFCAGLDLKELFPRDRKEMQQWWNIFVNAFTAILKSRLHTVCAINGSGPAGF